MFNKAVSHEDVKKCGVTIQAILTSTLKEAEPIA
jgi:hypothetical protein